MARNISVKVPTSTLIAEIEKRIVEIDNAIVAYPAEREKYDNAVETYKAKVAKFVATYLTKNADKIGYTHNDIIRISTNYSGRIELTFDSDSIDGFPVKPEEPKKPNQNEWFGREHATRKSLLEKNLRILKMTSQDEVNASTYGAIMEIL